MHDHSNASIALLIGNHVLEHVADDRAAMAEIRRILAPDGIAALMVPLDIDRATSDEDASVTTAAERLRRFRHDEHVRIYGRDFAGRLAAGLHVEAFHASKREVKLYRVDPAEASRRAVRARAAICLLGSQPDKVRRRRSSANRVLTILKAALNHAWREGRVPLDDAWRRVQPFPRVDAARVRYLSHEEGQRLIQACDPQFRPMVQAAQLTGARYGELARLEVRDLNRDSRTIHVRRSKSGQDRHVALNDAGYRLVDLLCRGRGGADLIFRKADGTAWGKSHQHRPINEACVRAGIVPTITFHELRHTWASLAIMAGAPLFVVAKNLGHADTRMVEKHYGHLAPSFIAEMVRRTAPTFEGPPRSVIPPLSPRTMRRRPGARPQRRTARLGVFRAYQAGRGDDGSQARRLFVRLTETQVPAKPAAAQAVNPMRRPSLLGAKTLAMTSRSVRHDVHPMRVAADFVAKRIAQALDGARSRPSLTPNVRHRGASSPSSL